MVKHIKYVLYYDLLNICACLCVIFMHCNGIVHGFSDSRAWKEALIVEVLAYWAVPVFFMISGATLMGYREKYSTKVYFEKRFIKTLIPFLIWNVINLVLKICKNEIEIDIELLNPIHIFDMVINSSIEPIYWFFIPLFIVYLSIPVLSVLKDNVELLKYIVVIGLLTDSVFPLIFNILNISYNGNLYFPLTGGYILYVIIGYLLATVPLEKKCRYCIYFGGIVGIFIRYGTTYFLSIKEQGLNKLTWGYKNFPAVLLSVAVFVFFKYIEWEKVFKTEMLKNLIRNISSASFGIYLIHMIIIRALLSIFHWNTYGWKWRWGGPFIVYGSALCIVLIIKKVPILRKIVP